MFTSIHHHSAQNNNGHLKSQYRSCQQTHWWLSTNIWAYDLWVINSLVHVMRMGHFTFFFIKDGTQNKRVLLQNCMQHQYLRSRLLKPVYKWKNNIQKLGDSIFVPLSLQFLNKQHGEWWSIYWWCGN